MREREPDFDNEVLDEIIARRRSIRAFTEEVPSRALVEAIVAAGLAAPFAQAAVGSREDFRRFLVFSKGSPALESLISLLCEKGQAQLRAVQERAPDDAPFLKKLEALAEGRTPGLGTAPYLIAVAELRGMPPVEQQAIAFCLENMWLKATALGLGFHLVSALAMLGDEPRFWALVGLPPDTFDVNGCAIGKPAALPPLKPPQPANKAIAWME